MSPRGLTDVYAYATELARCHALSEASFWFPYRQVPEGLTVLTPGNKDQMNPAFQGSPVSIAVALLPDVNNLPPGTPIMWTRGLQPDGTWRADSPYDGQGGYIGFSDDPARVPGVYPKLVVYCEDNVGNKLVKWGTKEPTRNIFEALPPGTKISEYVPTPETARHEPGPQLEREWQKTARRTLKQALVMVFIALWSFGACGVLRGCSQVAFNARASGLARSLFGLFGLLVGLPALIWVALPTYFLVQGMW